MLWETMIQWAPVVLRRCFDAVWQVTLPWIITILLLMLLRPFPAAIQCEMLSELYENHDGASDYVHDCIQRQRLLADSWAGCITFP